MLVKFTYVASQYHLIFQDYITLFIYLFLLILPTEFQFEFPEN